MSIACILMQNLEVDLIGFCLALAQYFLTIFPVPCFGIVMYSLHHCVLERCDLLFNFDFCKSFH